ncbi:MAG: deoxyribodipyrimidine photo-lyase [Acidobacteria bacterium]|nr:deoxyribodipyrimidine photo-lyase [Acidobacteriota bacterium]
MERSFASRQELAEYLAQEFPTAAARDAQISPIPGGREAGEAVLAAIQPDRYGFDRNYLDGHVSRLSPYIRHGILTLTQAKEFAFAMVKDRLHAAKFVTELAWRDYWQRLYAAMGKGVWEDREEPKTGLPPGAYASQLPADIATGETGLACIDSFVRELRSTGYLHNHARMWFAAYVVHFRRVRWQAGAAFFLSHLLDGDPASNNLSWQWVASTFSHKPYFFNRENLEKYTHGLHCKRCPVRGRCDFEGSYEQLESKLFRIEAR